VNVRKAVKQSMPESMSGKLFTQAYFWKQVMHAKKNVRQEEHRMHAWRMMGNEKTCQG
jgi:hypothetical protein